MSNLETLLEKWKPVIENAEIEPIADLHKRRVTASILENTQAAIDSGECATIALKEDAPANSTGTAGFGSGIANYDPVLITLVRRSIPNLMAYDIAGVQAMNGPTGLIFAMRSKYTSSANSATEALFNEADTDFSGAGTHAGTTGTAATANTGTGMTTATGEALGDYANNAFAEMTFSIEKVTATAKTRALKGEYSSELAQDLKAVHGLDAESELANILASELLAEINREVVRTVYNVAKTGAQDDTTTAGTFDLDTDSNGRWMKEKFNGLMFQIDREANKIGIETRRGRGNILICSSDVASALRYTGVLDTAPAVAMNSNLNVDPTGNTFIGILNGHYRVYVDPYAGGNYVVVGYKGVNPYDAGIFYAPYVPLQMVRAVGENSFQPKLGFKTRYAMVANPFAQGTAYGAGALTANSNVYYRRVLVTNIM